MSKKVEELAAVVQKKVAAAKSIAVLTGAGISAESGVPTFRGEEGLWKNYRAEELATPNAFARDPKLVWEWYDWRRGLIAPLEPNPAHRALVQIEVIKDKFALVTQNVDGLHMLAGSKNILEIHGNIWKVRCTRCGKTEVNRDVPIEILPYCGECKGLLRPAIVWFGESLPEDVLTRAMEAIQECDVFLVIGTSGVVQPAASFAGIAKRAGAFVAEINLDPTPSTGNVDVAVHGKAGEIMPLVVP